MYLYDALQHAALERENEQYRQCLFDLEARNHGLFLGLIKGSASLLFFGGRTVFC